MVWPYVDWSIGTEEFYTDSSKAGMEVLTKPQQSNLSLSDYVKLDLHGRGSMEEVLTNLHASSA
jgi:hypothetical protein